MVRIIQNRYIYCLLNFSITLKIHCLTNIASLNMHARASKISFTGAWMPSLLKPVQKNILCLEILCSSWPYKEHVSLPPSLCAFSYTKWNKLCKGKYWNRFRCNCIKCFFFFLWQFNCNLKMSPIVLGMI